MTAEREKLIEMAIVEKYEKYTNQVVALFKAIPDKLSGDDSPLKNAWEEWVYQVQYQQSAFYYVYEEQIRLYCKSVIDEMSPAEVKLLWAGRDPVYQDELEDGMGFLVLEQMKGELEDELFRLVEAYAAGEDLSEDFL